MDRIFIISYKLLQHHCRLFLFVLSHFTHLRLCTTFTSYCMGMSLLSILYLICQYEQKKNRKKKYRYAMLQYFCFEFFLSFLKCCSSTTMNTTVKIYSHYISLRINFTCLQVNPPLKESTLRCFIHNISPLKISVFYKTPKTVTISTEPWTAFERTLTDLDVIMASTILTVQCKVNGIQ